MSQTMQIHQFLKATAETLMHGGIEDGGLEAEFMLRHVLRYDRTRLFMMARESLSEEQRGALRLMVSRRLNHEPLAYILGEWDFRGRSFLVNPSVLIPRPETEQLVDVVLELRARYKSRGRKIRLLDVGCGSGAIGVSLALESLSDTAFAMDVSPMAITVAKENARRLGVGDRMHFVLADLRCMPFGHSFDFVVANLPYIRSDEIERLMPEVARFEPLSALDGGLSGTLLLQALGEELDALLLPGGWVVLEIGADQEDFVIELFQGLQYDQVAVMKDYAGLPRILQARRKETGNG